MSKQREVVPKLRCEHESVPASVWIRQTLVGKECVKCFSFLEDEQR